MRISQIFLFFSLLLFLTPNAIAFNLDPSEKSLKSPINLAQNNLSPEELIWKNAALGSLAIALAEIGDRDRMVEILNRLENREIRQQILSELAVRLARKGEIKFADNLIQKEGDLRVLTEIFQKLIAASQIDSAWEWVQLANEENNQILLLFVDAAIANQEYDHAWEILRNLDRNLQQLISFRGLAWGFAEQGKSDRILEIVELLDNHNTKQDFTLLAALSFAESGQPKPALDIVPQLEREINRVHALGVIGLKFIAKGERDRGEEQFDRLRKLLPQLEANGQTDSVLSNLSTYLARGGEFDLALELSHLISNPSSRGECLFYLTRHLGQAGEFSRALKLISKIEISGFREASIQQIAVNLAERGKTDRALNLLRSFPQSDETLQNIATVLAEKGEMDRALEIAEKISSPELKIFTLTSVAFYVYQDRQLETSRSILDRALQLWQTLENPTAQDSLLSSILLPFIENEIYDLPLEILQKTPNLAEKSNTLRDAAYAVAETGRNKESLQFIALMDDEIEQIGALIFLAVQLDEPKEAIATLTRALELTENLQNREQKALLLSSIATQFAELGRSQKAVEIVNRVLKLLEIEN